MSADHPTETFRPIAGFPGYEIGDYGTVRSWRRRGPVPRKPRPPRFVIKTKTVSPFGYHLVGLVDRRGKVDQKFVHCLVLEAFVGPRPEGMQCRHLDGNKLNNRLDNLCWGTPKENAADRDRHGRTAACRGRLNGNAILTEAQVIEIRRRSRGGEKINALAAEFGIAASTVSGIIVGFRWKHLPLNP